MQHKTRTKALSVLLSFALALTLIPALGGTARAGESEDRIKLIDYPTSQNGISLGNCSVVPVRIHENTDEVGSIKISSKYKSEDSITEGNYVTLSTEGGFKAGDIVTIAGVYNNTVEKEASLDLFTLETGSANVLYETGQVINSRSVSEDPPQKAYTLTADAPNLFIGRGGNTATHITLLTVTRTPVAVTGVSLPESATVVTGGTITLTPTFSPENANQTAASWTSDAPAVATVDENGKVTGVSAGTANITVTATNGTEETTDDYTATCSVSVTDPTYTITIPAKLTVEKVGWNATAGITASGAIAEGTRLTVTATSANEWKLKKDETNTVDYYLATEEGGEQVTAWSFTAGELAADNGTNKPMGAVVADYVNAPEGDYTDTVTFTAKVESLKTLTITDNYTDKNDSTQTYSITFEYYESETWKDLVDRYDELSLSDWSSAPDGYVIRILKADVKDPMSGELQIKSSDSIHNSHLVGIKDKVSLYRADSYSFHD